VDPNRKRRGLARSVRGRNVAVERGRKIVTERITERQERGSPSGKNQVKVCLAGKKKNNTENRREP